MPSIKVRPTALALPTILTLTFNFLRAAVMAYSHATVHDQWLVGFEDKMETNRRTDEGDCITCHINEVNN